YTITRVLAESSTFKEASPKILQALCECLEWDVGVLWTAETKTGTLHCSEMWHKPAVEIPEFEALTRQITFSPHVGLPGSVYASKAPLWITNVVSDANFPRVAVAAKEKLHGAFGFPVLTGDTIFGVIELFSREIQPSDDDLLKLMASIGEQIGQFIKRKRSEESLIHRIDFEKTVASISSRFIVFSDFNNAIFKSLADAGRLCDAGRAYLFQFRDNGAFMDNSNEWHAEEVAPEIQHLQNLPTAMFPWLMKNLQAGNVIHIPDVSQMPAEAAFEKQEFEKRDIKATVILPVNTEKELIGFVGFDSVVAVDPWHEEDIALLHITAEIIGNAVARKHSEALITYMAYHDTLTGLPNRNLFQDRLKVALVHAQRHKRMVAVMIIDLDQFKTVNDVLGHHIGDLLLKEIAGRLTHCVRKGDTIARTGGDEFTIILPDLIHALNTIIVASKIIDALNQTFRLEGHEIHATSSIGISLYPLDAESPEDLVKKADIAMYLSKARGKNTYRFYRSEMNNVKK
ncbi:MAG: diguanylate cyclase, partial [Candidatus Brocadia sp.]